VLRAINGYYTGAPLQLKGGTLSQTTVTGPAGIQFTSISAKPTLDAVTLAAPAVITGNAMYFRNGLNLQNATINANQSNIYFTGTQTLSGTGTVTGGTIIPDPGNPGTLTISSGITFGPASVYLDSTLGVSSAGAIVNFGTITSNAPPRTRLLAGTFMNAGMISASNGGTIWLNSTGNWTNTGTLQLQPNSALILGGSDLQNLNLGNFSRTGGTVRIAGALSNATLPTNAFGGFVFGYPHEAPTNGYAHMTGGAITPAVGVPSFTLDGFSIFDGVRIDADVQVPHSHAYFINGLTLNGHVSLHNDFDSQFYFGGNSTLSGIGVISFDGTPGPLMDTYLRFGGVVFAPGVTDGVTTIGPGITIRTGISGGFIVTGSGGVINQGLISASTPGQKIVVNTPGRLTNQGTLEVRNGASFSGTLTNAVGGILTGGKWVAYANSTLAGLSNILTNNADVTLSGPNSTINGIDTIATNNGRFAVLDGRDFITGGTFNNNGVLQLGINSEIDIPGDFNQSPAATLAVEVAAPYAQGNGPITVTSIANLNGTFSVLFPFTTTIHKGDTLSFLSASAIAGTFNSITLPPGVLADPIYTPTTFSLHFTSVPEPASTFILSVTIPALCAGRRRSRRTL
jgi:hypothetical protein